LQRRIILAATALAAALIVPTLASATDKQVGPGDRSVPEAWQNRDQGGNTSAQNQMAVGGPNSAPMGPAGGSTPTGTGVGQALGGQGPTQQLTGHVGGSTPTGQAGGDGTTAPIEAAITCGPAKGKTPKDGTSPTKGSKNDEGRERTSPDVPKGDDEAALEDELREQQEMLDRLTDLLNQMQQRNNDLTRGITGG
jgi:hypothetical protein